MWKTRNGKALLRGENEAPTVRVWFFFFFLESIFLFFFLSPWSSFKKMPVHVHFNQSMLRVFTPGKTLLVRITFYFRQDCLPITGRNSLCLSLSLYAICSKLWKRNDSFEYEASFGKNTVWLKKEEEEEKNIPMGPVYISTNPRIMVDLAQG